MPATDLAHVAIHSTSRRRAVRAVLATALVLTGCATVVPVGSAEVYPSKPVAMTAGANPGSGFDLTIRSVVEALQKDGLVDVPLPVQNRPGAGGVDFLATMVEQYAAGTTRCRSRPGR